MRIYEYHASPCVGGARELTINGPPIVNILSRIGGKVGIDQSVAYALLVRGWQVFAGPVTVALIAITLDPKQQGFYFTFASILALQVFFEMGLSLVIQQFVSHELPRLTWVRHAINGDAHVVERFRALLRKSLTWFAIAAFAFGLATLIAGLEFFTREQETNFSWRAPWVVLVAATAFNMLFIPLTAALEGGGHVVEVNRLRLIQSVTGNLLAWTILLSGGRLYAAPAIAGASLLVSVGWFTMRHSDLIRFIFKPASPPSTYDISSASFSWASEIWPMQWRIAVSWMSGYLISQLFTPVLFHYHGAVVAGRMGMTLTIANGLASVALIWVNVRMWRLGSLVAMRDWNALDNLFAKIFRQSLAVVTAGAVLVVLFTVAIQPYSLSTRFLPPIDVIFLMTSVVINHVIASLAQYLRAHKREPFVWLSVVGGVLVGVSTWFLGWKFASFGMVSGLLLINLFYGLPTAVWLWLRLREQWHRPDSRILDTATGLGNPQPERRGSNE